MHGLHNKVHFMYVDSINTYVIIVVILYPWYGMAINHIVNDLILIRCLKTIEILIK